MNKISCILHMRRKKTSKTIQQVLTLSSKTARNFPKLSKITSIENFLCECRMQFSDHEPKFFPFQVLIFQNLKNSVQNQPQNITLDT